MSLKYQRLTDPNLNFAKYQAGDLVEQTSYNPILYDYHGKLIKAEPGIGVILEVHYYEVDSHLFLEKSIGCEYTIHWVDKNTTSTMPETMISKVKSPI